MRIRRKRNIYKQDHSCRAEVKYQGYLLTERQIEILSLIGEGHSNSEISVALNLSPRTIESHIAKIREIVSSDGETRIGDRRLVVLAKEMLDGYKLFLKTA